MSLHSSFALFLAVKCIFFYCLSAWIENHIFSILATLLMHTFGFVHGLRIGVSMKVSVCFDKQLCGDTESILKDL